MAKNEENKMVQNELKFFLMLAVFRGIFVTLTDAKQVGDFRLVIIIWRHVDIIYLGFICSASIPRWGVLVARTRTVTITGNVIYTATGRTMLMSALVSACLRLSFSPDFALSFVVQIETYAGQAEVGRDCPGEEFSAEPWSNPISDEVLDNTTGIDCMRWCYFTETCFGVVVVDHKCYLKNDKCFANLRDNPGAVLGGTSYSYCLDL